eukprot:TRINITY_DN8224_c1_g1_i1.p1 TRINITY_DN8224_c1_g1~~TRINITY_DN8224_c1_g1_i1.p1  ORF type:complete len:165 (-),score=6.58 TRINITY_DN8224_c1_g1_i1:483-953(-)
MSITELYREFKLLQSFVLVYIFGLLKFQHFVELKIQLIIHDIYGTELRQAAEQNTYSATTRQHRCQQYSKPVRVLMQRTFTYEGGRFGYEEIENNDGQQWSAGWHAGSPVERVKSVHANLRTSMTLKFVLVQVGTTGLIHNQMRYTVGIRQLASGV